MNTMIKVMVYRLYVRLLDGTNVSFDFALEENAVIMRNRYVTAGCTASYSHVMINDDHIVPWSVS